MKRILVINPSTTQSGTDRVVVFCRAEQPDLLWKGVTARFGVPYIASEVSYAVAAHAVLDAFEAGNHDHDAGFPGVGGALGQGLIQRLRGARGVSGTG